MAQLIDASGVVVFEGEILDGAVKSLDLGVVTAVEVATGGPKLLYAPASGEFVYGGKVWDVTFVDTDVGVVVGPLAGLIVDGDAGNLPQAPSALAYYDSDLSAAFAVPLDVAGNPTAQPNAAPLFFVTDPIVAAWVTSNATIVVDAAPGTWQALHAYAEGAWLIDSEGALQRCTTGGTSGASEPAWPGLDNDGTTTDDGSVQWTQEGNVPSAGSGHFAVIAETPAAP